MGSVMSVMFLAATPSLPLLCSPLFAETSSPTLFADRILLILQTPPLTPPLEGRGWLRIELRGGQGATKSPGGDGCALNYAAGKERQKAPKRLRGPRFIRSADIF